MASPTYLLQHTTIMLDEDYNKEFNEALASDITLKTDATKCKVCKVGDVVLESKKNKDDGNFLIYTRNGTLQSTHLTYRYLFIVLLKILQLIP